MSTCAWATKNENELKYHDAEWGVPVYQDDRHFEMLTLESAQSGLSWSTILAKRDGYKEAFKNFNVDQVAQFTEQDIEALVVNEKIVRHRQKISSTINNAKAIQEIQKEFGTFNSYIWAFVNFEPIDNKCKSEKEVPGSTDLSLLISKDLKKRGFKFLGTTTVYAYMQAIAMVNDHVITCPQYEKTCALQKEVKAYSS